MFHLYVPLSIATFHLVVPTTSSDKPFILQIIVILVIQIYPAFGGVLHHWLKVKQIPAASATNHDRTPRQRVHTPPC